MIAFPLTSSFWFGEVVPIPTLPAAVNLTFSVLFVRKTKSVAFCVPINGSHAVVPRRNRPVPSDIVIYASPVFASWRSSFALIVATGFGPIDNSVVGEDVPIPTLPFGNNLIVSPTPLNTIPVVLPPDILEVPLPHEIVAVSLK